MKLSRHFVRTFTFTAKAFNIPKSWRRIPICKSRKRFIKKTMALGWKRNEAAAIANIVKKYNGDISYQHLYRVVLNQQKHRNELERKESQ